MHAYHGDFPLDFPNAQLTVWDGATLMLEGVKTWAWVYSTYVESVAIGCVGDEAIEIVTGGYYHNGTRWVAQLAVWAKT